MAPSDHRTLYALAFLEGDTAAMQRQADWAKGKPDEFDHACKWWRRRPHRAASYRKPERLPGKAVEIARSGESFEKSGRGSWQLTALALKRWWEIPRQAREQAAAGAGDQPEPASSAPSLGSALALAGEREGDAIADES